MAVVWLATRLPTERRAAATIDLVCILLSVLTCVVMCRHLDLRVECY